MANPQEADKRPKILLIDDEEEFCKDLITMLAPHFNVNFVQDENRGMTSMRDLLPDAILLDVDLGKGRSGLDVLLEIRKMPAPPPVLMLTGDKRIDTAVQAIRRGAYDYIIKPPNLEEMTRTLLRALAESAMKRKIESLQSELAELRGDLIVEDKRMLDVLRQVEKVGPTDATVLITGESGTGKEIIARRIHQLSPRSHGPFVGVNCAAIPSNLMESALFGHEKGAFTDAGSLHRGHFELANRGTLFLDELGDSPAELQVKLLRVLQERVFSRLGSETRIGVDVRILAATSKDVEKQVAAGRLREELYYRLNVFRIHIPPLRDRRADILPIALHYIAKYGRQYGRPARGLTPAAREVLTQQPWPGNVRELQNSLQRAVIQCEDHEIDLHDIFGSPYGMEDLSIPYDHAKERVLQQFKIQYLTARLRETDGKVTLAAEKSGLKRQSFQRMVQECGLDPNDFHPDPRN
ncbi:MAG: sigma-54 dependent transcriptional regulator [Candidatus Eisenbacteria bacterium]|uniref:Sigma-54 dependent transcriptional regulator n=1 Tax=Eiseniibacteriota bacterium TaxID=2212470 RepID=A0A948RZA6_UNCEI|nr:sigma-54 dependent transcriptional regulator [Candidatus Eisenbacteria bacterium]MBU1947602.1 sigma-54 dependent transcriptional regulator [Candidatus Eisenbacteria bacterium]MBU2692372.1 sigma-54 dependent transcriptional regulator [Candidatus Eisenbacteria bacterium]